MSAAGDLVVYDYGAAAISCCQNGKRIRGIARVTGRDREGWFELSNGKRVRPDEISLHGTHPFSADAGGYGCTVCGFNSTAEIHAGATT